jgi:hypothetical protein
MPLDHHGCLKRSGRRSGPGEAVKSEGDDRAPGDPDPAAKEEEPQTKQARVSNKLSLEDVTSQWRSAKREQAREEFKAMSTAAQEDLVEAYKDSQLDNEPEAIRKLFSKSGISGKTVEATFLSWLVFRQFGEPTESDLLQFMLDRAGG